MATRDWSALGWTPNLSFAPQTDFQLARSSLADAGKGAEYKFDPNAQNAALLASLGYGGPSFTTIPGSEENPAGQQVWSDEARNWLNANGFNVGVAHDPGTSPGGRPEYYGLTGPNGQFVSGQSDPTQINSDTLMDQISMFATFLGPVIGGIAAAGGGLGAGSGMAGIGADGVSLGSGAAAGGSSGIGSLGAAADGLTSLGSAWSPEALGLTGGISPGVSAAELASLSQGIPGLVEAAGGIGAGLGTLGGSESGLSALGSSWSPEALGLTQPIAQGTSAAELASLSQGIPGAVGFLGGAPDLSPITKETIGSVTPGATQAEIAGLSQGIPGAITSPVADPYDNKFTRPGGPAELGNMGGASGGAATLPSVNMGGGLLDSLGSLGSSVGSVIKPISDAVGGGGNLAALVGAGLGAASGGGTQTSSRDPWAAAQPFLKNILGDAETMRAGLAAQPYTPQQTSAYNNAFAGLDQARSALPGLLNWGQGAMQRQSTTPSWASLFGGQQPGAQPTAQAGGAGGLLGDSQQDRMKALMARGRGLIG